MSTAPAPSVDRTVRPPGPLVIDIRASTGSRRLAFTAGAKPDTIPVATEIARLNSTSQSGNTTGRLGASAATDAASVPERTSPATPPTTQIATASTRNCSRIARRRAPSALRVPISRVRSFTLT